MERKETTKREIFVRFGSRTYDRKKSSFLPLFSINHFFFFSFFPSFLFWSSLFSNHGVTCISMGSPLHPSIMKALLLLFWAINIVASGCKTRHSLVYCSLNCCSKNYAELMQKALEHTIIRYEAKTSVELQCGYDKRKRNSWGIFIPSPVQIRLSPKRRVYLNKAVLSVASYL